MILGYPIFRAVLSWVGVFLENNVSFMGSQVADPQHIHYHTDNGRDTINELPTPLSYAHWNSVNKLDLDSLIRITL